MVPTLVSIAYSPWSRRAKLALERQGIDFRLKTYTPGVSEPWLRMKLRKPFARVTVPVLLLDGGALTDSLEIAYWASDRSDTPLAPPRLRAQIEHWNARAEAALGAGRLRTTELVMQDDVALTASLPPALRKLPKAVGRGASRWLLSKYGNGGDMGNWNGALAGYIEELGAALEEGEHLCGEPSYADIVAAFGLAFIAPDRKAKVPPEARKHWSRPDLEARFSKVIAWRDRILFGADA